MDDEETRIDFGPKQYQSLPAEAATLLLTMWRERQPAQFGAYLAEVMTGEPPRTRKARS